MKLRTWLIATTLAGLPVAAQATTLDTGLGAVDVGSIDGAVDDGDATKPLARLPMQLEPAQRDAYRTVFAAIRAGRWQDAQLALDAMAPGALHPVARAELVVAKGSPKASTETLVSLLTEAPDLPQAEALRRFASARGVSDLPPLPAAQRLIWDDGAPRRVRAKATASDMVAADLANRMQPFVKADDGASAEALLAGTSGLSSEAQTEWQARVAWMYFLSGDDAKVRELGSLAANGVGDWAVQGRWMAALSAWRQGDCAAAASGFEGVAARAGDVDLRAAGFYWASRADMACNRPDRIQARLKAAAQFGESFYGQLARQALAMRTPAVKAPGIAAGDWARLDRRPNVRVAAALVEIGETDLADTVIRQQAKIGNPAEFGSLIRLAEALDLPQTTLFLAHNLPNGVTATADAHYPTPDWTPDSGWRVDKALIYAHALEESRFRANVTSPAGAYGLMQIMPAAATDFARERGVSVDKAALSRPSTNIDIGQRHLERLRDMGLTGGLLPKVIAAYNAGPKPVGEWNALVRDGGDPLLYIESIPYWETRGYVTTVLRNYWMYEARGGKAASASRAALAQGLWPRFPGLSGATAVRMTPAGGARTMVATAAPVRSVPRVTPTVTARVAAPFVTSVATALVPATSVARVPAAPLAIATAKVTPPVPTPPVGTTARVAAIVKAIPGAVKAAAGAVVDNDLLKAAGAAMAMQPQAIVGAIAGGIGAVATGAGGQSD